MYGCGFSAAGLSPRGRGKPNACLDSHSARRSIPAWAGETAYQWPLPPPSAVYPRVGGGNKAAVSGNNFKAGLSPRGRGKRVVRPSVRAITGSIPAWAGETVGDAARTRFPPVYPRVGGGNPVFRDHELGLPGLSPRGRGKLPLSGLAHAPSMVYPRVGGGNPGRPAPGQQQRGLSPRGRGKPPGGTTDVENSGLSPRGRGKPRDLLAADADQGSIPAWAGETHGKWPDAMPLAVYPRVGGGNPIDAGLWSSG